MGYEFMFQATSEQTKQKAIEYFKNDEWDKKYAEEHGIFFSQCGWEWKDFVADLRSVSLPVPDEKEREYSFFVPVSEFKTMYRALSRFFERDGTQLCLAYAEINRDNFQIEIYNKQYGTPIQLPDYNPYTCYIDVFEYVAMKKTLVTDCPYFDAIGEQIIKDAYGLYFAQRLYDIINYVLYEAPDDEDVRVIESY